MVGGTVPSGRPDGERPKSIPEIRGFPAPSKERDPAKKYSPASYAAQYGVPLEDAEELVRKLSTHAEVVRAINQLFSADPDLKRAAFDPFAEEKARAARIRAADEEGAARRKAERAAKARARRDRLRREMLGMPPESEEAAG